MLLVKAIVGIEYISRNKERKKEKDQTANKEKIGTFHKRRFGKITAKIEGWRGN